MMGFGFALAVAIWVLWGGLIAVIKPVFDNHGESEGKSDVKPEPKKEVPKKETKTPKSEPKKEVPKKEVAVPKTEPKKETSKADTPKKEKIQEAVPKSEPKKEVAVPKTEPKVAIPKKEVPKAVNTVADTGSRPMLKVMSSKQAAEVRESRKKEASAEVESESKHNDVVEDIHEQMDMTEKKDVQAGPEESDKHVESKTPMEPEMVSEPEEDVEDVEDVVESVSEVDNQEDVYEGEYEVIEDTPDALVRRAAWNKGLRCRRNYGDHNIPVAFVKGKVAVYVVPEAGDTSLDDVLESEGWTVLRYLEADITDGKAQGDEISKAVKNNLRAERASKKKKSTKK